MRRQDDLPFFTPIVIAMAVLITTIAVIIGLFFYVTDAKAHSAPTGWIYPSECCSGRDCAEIPTSAVKEGPNGYQVTLLPGQHPMIKAAPHSFLVPYGTEKVSPDGLYHACLSPTLRLLCFYAGGKVG